MKYLTILVYIGLALFVLKALAIWVEAKKRRGTGRGPAAKRSKVKVFETCLRRYKAVWGSEVPRCPFCHKKMVLRAREADGKPFYGCKDYPKCHGIVDVG